MTFNFGATPFKFAIPYGYIGGWGGSVPSAPPGDANWPQVVFLCGFEASRWDESTVNNKGGYTIQTGNIGPTTAQAYRGKFSLGYNNQSTVVGWAASADWNFGSSNFTIEIAFRPGVVTGIHTLVSHWGVAPNQGWSLQQNGAALQFIVSTTGSDTITHITTGSVLAVNTWYAVAVDYDSANSKYRLYVNGAMAGSSTTPRTIFASTVGLWLGGDQGAGSSWTHLLDGWLDEVRITKGAYRYASDSGYAPAAGPFPRYEYGLVVSPATLNPSTANGVTLSNGNLTVTNATVPGTTAGSQGVTIPVASPKTAGKLYFEYTWTALPTGGRAMTGGIGIGAVGSYTYADLVDNYAGSSIAVTFTAGGYAYSGGTQYSGNQPYNETNDVIGVAVDLSAHQAWFRIVAGPDAVSTWNDGAGADPSTGVGGVPIVGATAGQSFVPIALFGNDTGVGVDSQTINFGATTFAILPPVGFKGWCGTQ
jgi:hypothetical protein